MASSVLAIERQTSSAAGQWIGRLGVACLCVGLSAASVVPFFFLGETPGSSRHGGEMPVTHDMVMHFNQMTAFYTGLAAGKVYPRWQAETNHGFGAPTTSFYPPGVYYLTSALYFALRDWVRVLLSAYLMMMMASAAAIYLYARQVMSRGAAVVAMVAYTALPYHLINQYQRGAIAEQLSFIWMPLVLFFATRLFNSWERTHLLPLGVPACGTGPRRWTRRPSLAGTLEACAPRGGLMNLAGLAASYGAFIWSHPPTAYQFTLALGLFVVILAMLRGDWRGGGLVGGGLMLGLLLSAAYLYPAVVEQRFINYEDVAMTWPYHTTYVLDYAARRFDHFNDDFVIRIDHIWLLNTAAFILATAVLLVSRRPQQEAPSRLKESVLLWAVVGGFASVMMTPASAPLGRLIPKLEIGVFSWRLLSITTLITALLAGACVEAARDAFGERRRGRLVVCSAVAALILAGGAAFSVMRVAMPMYRAEAFKPHPEHFNYATVPRTGWKYMPEADPVKLAAGKGSVAIERWDPERRRLRAELSGADQLSIRTFNFPGWTAAVDGQAARIGAGELGNILLALPAGSHQITLDFLATPARQWGGRVTVAACFLLIVLALASLCLRIRTASGSERDSPSRPMAEATLAPARGPDPACSRHPIECRRPPA